MNTNDYTYHDELQDNVIQQLSQKLEALAHSRVFDDRLDIESKINIFTYPQLKEAVNFRLSLIGFELFLLCKDSNQVNEETYKNISLQAMDTIANDDLHQSSSSVALLVAKAAYDSKLINKAGLKKYINTVLNEVNSSILKLSEVTHNAYIVDLYTCLPAYLEFKNVYKVGDLNKQFELILDSGIFKTGPRGKMSLGEHFDLNKLASLNDEQRLKIWYLARSLNPSIEQIRKLNTLIENNKNDSFDNKCVSLMLGSWRDKPELFEIDAKILDTKVSLDIFRNVASEGTTLVNLKKDLIENSSFVKVKDDNLNTEHEITNRWLGTKMLSFWSSGQIGNFNLFNLPTAKYGIEIIKETYTTLSNNSEDKDKQFIPPKLLSQFKTARDAVELTGMTWFDALSTHVSAIENTEHILPESLVNDLML